MLKVGQPAENTAAKRSQFPVTVTVTSWAWLVGEAHKDMPEKDDPSKLLLCLFFTMLMKTLVESPEQDLIFF